MLPQWIIEKKRDGKELSDRELHFLIQGYTKGEIPDYQLAAFAMAVFFKGMSARETAALTQEMMNSGDVIDPARLPGITADKHSTGGIGDKTSIILAPLAATCGLTVPMISGRGLGITGGTLDKLESIPGYRTDLSESEFFHCLDTAGCSIIGQTAQLAPADKKLYALRDVTGTVPSIPLITASIMSKKMAEGIDSLVLDVKWGNGAFMKTIEQARELAHAMVEVGSHMGKRVRALITEMNTPLGRAVGNALEIQECLDVLNGGGPEDLRQLTVDLTAHMLDLSGIGKTNKDIYTCLQNGTARLKFDAMVTAQGGKNPGQLPRADHCEPLAARADGIITAVHAESIGKGCLLLGAGRQKTDDTIDHAVGINRIKKPGEFVKKGEPLAVIYSNDAGKKAAALPWFEKSFEMSDAFEPSSAAYEIIG